MTSKNKFDRKSLNSESLTLVHFINEWNGASQITSMIYDDLSKSYNGTANFYTVNFEEEKKLSKELGVLDVPTILFFKDGEIIDHTIGLVSKNTLIAKIETALSNTNIK